MRIVLVFLILLFCVHVQIQKTCNRTPASAGLRCVDMLNPLELRKNPDARNKFVQEYLNVEHTNTTQRQRFIDFAHSSQTSEENIFIVFDFSVLREMNTKLKDKNLVTSNAHKSQEIQLTLLGQVERKWNLQNQGERYSDYKSVQAAFPALKKSATNPTSSQKDKDLEKEFNTDIDKMFEASTQIFSDYVIDNQIIRKTDKPKEWFRAGTGHSLLQANVASRVSRSISGPNKVRHYASREVQEVLKDAFNWSNLFIGEVAVRGRDLGIFETNSAHQNLLHLKVFEFLRKSENESEFRQAMIQYFAYQNPSRAQALDSFLSPSLIEKLRVYKNLIDTFSPPVLSSHREITSLEEADKGGLSIDFMGLGALNLQATALALLTARHVDEVLTNSEKGEEEVTKLFQHRVKLLKKVLAPYFDKIIISGDDLVAYAKSPLTAQQKRKLMNEIFQGTDGAQMRVSFLSPNAKREERNLIVTHGEEIEKKLRLRALEKISPARLEELTIGIDMQSTSAGVGYVKLMVGSSNAKPVTATELKALQSLLGPVVEKYNIEGPQPYSYRAEVN